MYAFQLERTTFCIMASTSSSSIAQTPSGAVRSTNEVSLLRPSHQYGGARCPWLSKEEWKAVYSWMFSKNNTQLQKAVGRVAAWKARACVPIPIDVTSDLVECFLCESVHAHEEPTHQTLSLMYSMAITRFVNGISDARKFNELWSPKVEIIANVHEYAVPAWVVVLRHDGTHRNLPSLSALRSGAQFAMGWLKENYWEPQRQLLGIKRRMRRGKKQSSVGDCTSSQSPQTSLPSAQAPAFQRVKLIDPRLLPGKGVFQLTGGAFRQHKELITMLTEASNSTIAQHLRRQEILRLPPSVDYKVIIPSGTDLSDFPRLEFTRGSLAVWKGPLHNACLKSPSVKIKVLSALIMAIHGRGCQEETRDYLAACLGQFLQEHQELETVQMKGLEMVAAPSSSGEILTGSVDWMELLLVARAHPGYYSYAIMKIIMKHLEQLIPQETREHILYLSTLAALSERIGHLDTVPPELADISRGSYSEETKGLLSRMVPLHSTEGDVIVISSSGEEEDDVIVIDSDSSSEEELSPGRDSDSSNGSASHEELGDGLPPGRDSMLITHGLSCGKGTFLGPPPVKKLRLEEERPWKRQTPVGQTPFRQTLLRDPRIRSNSSSRGILNCQSGEEASSHDRQAMPSGRPRRWRVVSDLQQWIYCPIGLCPGQVATPTFLDLPLELDKLLLCDDSRTLNSFAESHPEAMKTHMETDHNIPAVFNETEITTIQNCITLL